MKTNKTELEVDFIGGLGSLMVEEENALSHYFREKKLNPKKPLNNLKTKTIVKTKSDKTKSLK